MEVYYIGFLDLNSSRSFGMGIGPIPWIAIAQYAQLKGLDDEQTEAIHMHITALDEVYLKHHSKKHK